MKRFTKLFTLLTLLGLLYVSVFARNFTIINGCADYYIGDPNAPLTSATKIDCYYNYGEYWDLRQSTYMEGDTPYCWDINTGYYVCW
jgi:hypothetical protein